MDQRVSMITLGAADLQRSIDFYTAMGWQQTAGETGVIAFFQLPGIILGIYGLDALAEDAGQPTGDMATFGGVAVGHNVGSKAEVDALMTKAESCGASVTRPAEDQFWGGYSGYFADPDGHAWEIAWNPHWQITADGQTHLGAG